MSCNHTIKVIEKRYFTHLPESLRPGDATIELGDATIELPDYDAHYGLQDLLYQWYTAHNDPLKRVVLRHAIKTYIEVHRQMNIINRVSLGGVYWTVTVRYPLGDHRHNSSQYKFAVPVAVITEDESRGMQVDTDKISDISNERWKFENPRNRPLVRMYARRRMRELLGLK